MNKSHQLQVAIVECLQNKLSGLNEKHAKKLQKTIVNAAKKLVRKYAKLEAREQKGKKKAQPAAAQPAPKKALVGAAKAAPQPATAKRPGPVARGGQKKAAPAKVAAGA